MTLEQLQKSWVDTPEHHKHVKELFDQLVDGENDLFTHRYYVESKVWGFGEKSFWWAWKLLLDTLDRDCNLLEIGVFRGATISLWRLLKPMSTICGITPMDSICDYWISDYEADIKQIHTDFNLEQPKLYKGLSTERLAKTWAGVIAPFDIVYVDGDHSYEGCLSDLKSYAPMVKSGGYLVMDDACSDMKMTWGWFQGHREVTNATIDFMKDNEEWEFLFNVVHLSIFRKK